jgi:Protein of unknown function (DUF1769)
MMRQCQASGIVLFNVRTLDMKSTLIHARCFACSLSGLLLKWAEQKNHDLHYSFGEEGKEKARVVVPAHAFFDRVVVTPQGDTPPSILEPLMERKETMELRLKQKQRQPSEDYQSPQEAFFTNSKLSSSEANLWTWNIADTYSMSFCTSNLDLPTWSLMDVPQLGNVGLKAILGKSMLRLVMYENLNPLEKGSSHSQNLLRYAFVVQVSQVTAQRHNAMDTN